MPSSLRKLSQPCYDLIVIGGGIYGLFAAWDAALRGLSVAVVEKAGFGGATSQNTLRVIHGGLRYLQYGDVRRMRMSSREQVILQRIAPDLVRLLPFVVPCYGYGTRSKLALSLAAQVQRWIGFQPNTAEKPVTVLSRAECLRRFPFVHDDKLTGAVMHFDGQLNSSEHFTAAILYAAIEAGVDAADYAQVTELITQGDRVTAVRVRDTLSDDEVVVRGKITLNTAGPWVPSVLALLGGRAPHLQVPLSKAFNLQVDRQLSPDAAVGVYQWHRWPHNARIYFILPWQNQSLIGTQHVSHHGTADDCQVTQVTEDEIQSLLDAVNRGAPGANFTRDEVVRVYAGLLPIRQAGQNVQLLQHYRIIDHNRTDGIDGLLSVVGVKFTESRFVAEKTINTVFKKLGYQAPRCTTAETPISEGNTGGMPRRSGWRHEDTAEKELALLC